MLYGEHAKGGIEYNHIPKTDYTTTATYADDTALLSAHSNPETASSQLQNHLIEVERWLNHWRIKANESKSVHVTFTLRRETCPPVTLNCKVIPQENNAKYLGMYLDRKLTWQKHIWTKRKRLDGKLRTLNWLLGRKSQLNPNSKMLVYKTTIKPIWTYGIQLWGTSSNSNIDILERFQTKALRTMFGIPRSISNRYIYLELGLKTVRQEVAQNSLKYQEKLTAHVNKLAHALSGEGALQHTRLKSLHKRFTT
ncbi:unnamed protein product [Parnassius apollo]|uniref:(apollo) hypothetical protein n=1 Tax=Parnassius apollo TaxID=110799 RepID=A0A8S3WPM9_PARAO|nr:unnamed protein product [Parnassius apollo]